MKKIAIAVSVLALAGLPAMAQDGPKAGFKAGVKEQFQEFDRNQDGVVTHDELMARAAQKFAEFDRDGNGVVLLEELPQQMPLSPRAERRLERMKERQQMRAQDDAGSRKGRHMRMSAEEFAAKHQPTRMKFMARFDKNADEQLVVEEFAAPMIKRYKRVDLNGDGMVTEAEIDEAMERGARHMRGKNRRNARG